MVDLHLHTTASDGTLTPEELVKAAVSAGVSILSITDHDTCAGAEKALAFSRACPGVTLLPGVELSAGRDVEVHILGYGVDGRAPSMRALFTDMHGIRVRRHHAIMRRLGALGIHLEDMPPGENPGRLRIAHELVRRGAADDVQTAMRRYLVEGGAAYVPRERPSADRAIRAIREAGGVAVLAHPAKLLAERPGPAEHALLHALLDSGLRGLECYHSACPPDASRALRALAAREGLLVTGGSDFHGGNKPGVDILSGLGHWRDAAQCAARLIESVGVTVKPVLGNAVNEDVGAHG